MKKLVLTALLMCATGIQANEPVNIDNQWANASFITKGRVYAATGLFALAAMVTIGIKLCASQQITKDYIAPVTDPFLQTLEGHTEY